MDFQRLFMQVITSLYSKPWNFIVYIHDIIGIYDQEFVDK